MAEIGINEIFKAKLTLEEISPHNTTIEENLGYVPYDTVNLAADPTTNSDTNAAIIDIVNFTQAIAHLTNNTYVGTKARYDIYLSKDEE